MCDVFLCFCHFPIWCPGLGVVFDCIDSWSLPSFLFWKVLDKHAPSQDRGLIDIQNGIDRYDSNYKADRTTETSHSRK